MFNQMSHYYTIAKSILLLLGVAVLFSFPVPAFLQNSPEIRPTGESHYIIFQRDKNGSIQPIFHSYVNLAAPLTSLNEVEATAQLQSVSRDSQKMGFSLVQNQTGLVVFRGVAEIPQWVRGEFQKTTSIAPGESNIDGYVFPLDSSVFVVRVPVLANTELRISNSGGQIVQAVDPAGIISTPRLVQESQRAINSAALQPLSGSPTNRVDLLVMGDGYTAAESSLFTSDYNSAMSSFFGLSPYSQYRNYVNVTSLFTASNESGADHPPYDAGCSVSDPNHPTCCSDSTAIGDPLSGTYVDTAFDATYCSYNIHRLLVVDTSLIYAAASAVPDWDEILVIVNDTTYGGSGGAVGVFSTNSYAVGIAQHEYGHSFTKLADEYDSPYPGFPSCSDTDGITDNDCEANVTNQTSRAVIKWNRWIAPSTPIITPPTAPYTSPSVTGLFQGARYLTSGMYRPSYNCLMRSLGQPFCAVSSEAYALRLYGGGWGDPAGGIDNIEPGTENPPTSSVIDLSAQSSMSLSASLLGPQSAPSLDIRWFVNNVQVAANASNTSASYTFTPAVAGSYTVRLEVMDVSPIINPTLRASLKTTREWMFNVLPAVPTLSSPANGATFSSQQPTLSWIAVTGVSGYKLQLDTVNPPATTPISVAGTSYTPSGFLPFGTYYWRVRSVDGLQQSLWSAVRSFTIASDAGAGVNRNYFTSATVTLTWNQLNWATAYEVQTSNNAAFTGSFNDIQDVPASQLSAVVTPPQDGTYYWRVRAQRSDGSWGTWSGVESFVVDVP